MMRQNPNHRFNNKWLGFYELYDGGALETQEDQNTLVLIRILSKFQVSLVFIIFSAVYFRNLNSGKI